MNLFEQIAEERIQEAIQNGDFKNLPGLGKPLSLSDNPFEPEDWRLANSLLRSNDIIYPWMETNLKIEQDLYQVHQTLIDSYAQADTLQAREASIIQFFNLIKGINHLILEYNLRVPSPVFQRIPLDPQSEADKVLSRPVNDTLFRKAG